MHFIVVAIIDRYNEMHGGALDPSIVFVRDDQAFNAYLLTIPDQVNIFFDPSNYDVLLHLKDRKVLEKYRGVPFPNYHKLKGILRCIESTISKLPSSDRNEALSMVPAVEFHPATHLPNQLPHSSSATFIYSDSTTSSAITPSIFPLTSETTLPPYVQPDLDYCYLPAPSSISNMYFPLEWLGNQQISGSDQQSAHENQHPFPLSIHQFKQLSSNHIHLFLRHHLMLFSSWQASDRWQNLFQPFHFCVYLGIPLRRCPHLL